MSVGEFDDIREKKLVKYTYASTSGPGYGSDF